MKEKQADFKDKALLVIKKLEAKIRNLQDRQQEPIAIVGLSCRFPGSSNSPQEYWDNILQGKDCISTVPENRWKISDATERDNIGKQRAGFIDDVEMFDAEFFGISPREANSMDPQQRLLLKVSWEAIESAGIQPDKLNGSNTGVFIGAVALDYRDRYVHQHADKLGTYTLTGNLLSIIAGRLSYTLGLQGPCMTVETACSSSLVAVHQACQSIRSGESDMVIAGGVNLLLSPLNMNMLGQAKTLAPDGYCKTFDYDANGLVRGEGCGVVVLKRLSDAIKDGNPVLAVIRGTKINHDGRAASLAAPNMMSQQALLSDVLKNASVKADDVGYIETHGTGTALGDPIEVQALKQVLGKERQNNTRCVLSSVKANIGHLEAAAGLAGLIKAVMVLRQRVFPPQIHFKKLNLNIDLVGTPFFIPTVAEDWLIPDGQKRIAGVSSFGISGTNAHVLLEEGPASYNDTEKVSWPCIFTVSAKNEKSLEKWVGAYKTVISKSNASAHDMPSIESLAFTSTTRSQHVNRAAFVVKSNVDLLNAIDSYLNKTPNPNVASDSCTLRSKKKIAFVFPGLGSQRIKMSVDLYNTNPVFKSVLDICEQSINSEAGWSLLALINSEDAQALDDIAFAQPALFAIGVGLASVWKSWGINPDVVIGHSMGEVASACVAGWLDIDNAVRLICRRSRIMKKLTGKGSMAIFEATGEQVDKLIAPYSGRISYAGSNSPRLTVLSGEEDALKALWEDCHRQRIFFRIVKHSIPSHSHLVDPLIEELLDQLDDIVLKLEGNALYSTVYCEYMQREKLGKSYWAANLRNPVQFERGVRHLIDDGINVFIEMSPHPTLTTAVDEILKEKAAEGVVVASLRDGTDDSEAMLQSLARLYVTGVMPDWRPLFRSHQICSDLPGYAWDDKKYWEDGVQTVNGLTDLDKTDSVNPASTDITTSDHPLKNIYLQLTWKVLPLSVSEYAAALGKILLMGDGKTDEGSVHDLLVKQGFDLVHVVRQQHYSNSSTTLIPVDLSDENCFDQILSEYFEDNSNTKIINMWAVSVLKDADETPEFDQLITDTCGATLLLIQALYRTGWRHTPKLTLVTRSSQSVAVTDISEGIFNAPLWGMGQVICYEWPDLTCTRIDLDATHYLDENLQLVNELTSINDEDQIALRKDGRYVARLHTLTLDSVVDRHTVQANEHFKSDSSYLISGGLGGLGLELAKWLVEKGARSLILTSRKGPTSALHKSTIEYLRSQGVTVSTPCVDVANKYALTIMFKDIQNNLPRLKGIFHLAGILDDGMMQQQTVERFQQVFRPKVNGAWHLHQLSIDLDLDWFILYSSASNLIGSPGQSNYAAANAFLDALARRRRSKGQNALSINWGAFIDVGLAAQTDSRAARLELRGMPGLTTDVAIQSLENILPRHDLYHVGVVPFNVRQWTEFYPQSAYSSYLSELTRDLLVESSQSEFLQQLKNSPAETRLDKLVDCVKQQTSIVLQMNPDNLKVNLPFKSFGMDSLTGMELRNRLESSLKLRLSAALIWTYPDILSLSKYLLSELSEVHQEYINDTDDLTLSKFISENFDVGLDSLSEDQLIDRLSQEIVD